MATFAPNIELLFTQHESMQDRIIAAAELGYQEVEMWMTSHLDVQSIAKVAKEQNVKIVSILAEPRFNFTLPGADFEVFYSGLKASIANAKILGSPRVVLGSGVGFPGKKRQPQLDQLIEIFKEAVKIAEAEGIDLVLEPVNTRVDHPGALLDRTSEAIYIAKGVNSSRFKILYDVYHSSVEGENVLDILKNNINLIGYIQIADAPGRGEPGSGSIDWPAVLDAIDSSGYKQPIGLEFYPTKDTKVALEHLRNISK